MPGSQPTVDYWDACNFLSLINGDADRLPDLVGLMDQAEKKQLRIVTSALSITEVAFANSEKSAGQLDQVTEKKIDGLWLPGSPVDIIELYSAVSMDARQLIRDGVSRGWALKPADAMHLATAKRIGVDRFLTYDLKALQRWSPILGFPIDEPAAVQSALVFTESTNVPVPPAGPIPNAPPG